MVMVLMDIAALACLRIRMFAYPLLSHLPSYGKQAFFLRDLRIPYHPASLFHITIPLT
jgi:hypothetical protein